MPQRIQRQPVLCFGCGIPQGISGETVAGLVNRQAQQHRRHLEQQIGETGPVHILCKI